MAAIENEQTIIEASKKLEEFLKGSTDQEAVAKWNAWKESEEKKGDDENVLFELTGIMLEGKNLDSIDFSRCILSNTSAQNVVFHNARFKNAILQKVAIKGAQFTGADLRYADLRGTGCQEAEFDGANLYQAKLQDANLSNASLNGARLQEAILVGADLKEVSMEGASLKEANLTGANLEKATLRGTSFEKAILTQATLREAVLDNAILSSAKLKNADLTKAVLTAAKLDNAQLENANLEGAHLEEANLFNARLEGAKLVTATLTKANFRTAFLKKADLSRATLDEASFQHANLSEAVLELATIKKTNFDHADLQQVILHKASLEEVSFKMTNLREASFYKATLKNIHFEGACLVEAVLHDAEIEQSNFRQANLEHADLRNVNLRDSILDRAYFKGADITGTKGLTDKWRLVHNIVSNPESGRELSKEDLSNANLSNAYLSGADLRKTNLRGTILDGANLLGVKFSRLDMRGQKGGAQFYMEVFPNELKTIENRRKRANASLPGHSPEPESESHGAYTLFAQDSLTSQYTEILYPSLDDPSSEESTSPAMLPDMNKIIYGDMVKLDLLGLALSGGGIRSATFCLGVIQVLQKYGMFKHVDYLSTVSGGGYIGSCLSTAMSDNRSENPFQYEKGEQEPQIVHHLRNSSKYLTASSYTDTLKPYAMFARGVLSNLLVVLIFVLPFAILLEGAGHLFFGESNPMEKLTDLEPLFLTLTVIMFGLLIMLLPFVLGWIQRSYYIKDTSLASFHWWAKRLTPATVARGGLLLLGLILVFWGVIPNIEAIVNATWGWVSGVAGTTWSWIQSNVRTLLWGIGIAAGAAALYYLARFSLVVIGVIKAIGSLLSGKGFSNYSKSRRGYEAASSTQYSYSQERPKDATKQPATEKPDNKVQDTKKDPSQYSETIERLTAWSFLLGFLFLGAFLVATNWTVLDTFFNNNVRWIVSGLCTVVVLTLILSTFLKPVRKIGLQAVNIVLGPFILFAILALPLFLFWRHFIHDLQVSDIEVFNLFVINSTAFQWIVRLLAFAGSVVAFVSLKWFYNPNVSSMHQFFRDRLSKAYLVRVNEQESYPDHVDDLKLSKLNKENSSAPYHLINVALNLPGSKADDLRGRNADFFFFGSRYTGGPRTGYCKTELLEKQDPHINLGTAMAISAAAAAPNMGTYTMKGLRTVLTLLNIRLGYWMTNPDRILDQSQFIGADSKVRRTLEQVSLGPLNLLNEFRGKLDEEGPSVNLSDGGHIENMGIYELLRRRCKFIISVEGASDPDGKFASFLQLIRYARIDMGIAILINLDGIIKGTSSWALGSIRYGPKKEHWGYLLYIKLTVTDELEHNYIRSYKKDHPEFPYESIADQSFDEAQFEVYRELGYQNARTFFEAYLSSEKGSSIQIEVDQLEALFEGEWAK
ncbi:MAG: pentapeptide repeat-containing protein [Rhodothermaceae bacterium]|nr:pentapeptide repeat-containing protein [Rhodothermaceae bacterium]